MLFTAPWTKGSLVKSKHKKEYFPILLLNFILRKYWVRKQIQGISISQRKSMKTQEDKHLVLSKNPKFYNLNNKIPTWSLTKKHLFSVCFWISFTLLMLSVFTHSQSSCTLNKCILLQKQILDSVKRPRVEIMLRTLMKCKT